MDRVRGLRVRAAILVLTLAALAMLPACWSARAPSVNAGSPTPARVPSRTTGCERWVSPSGSDRAPGSPSRPWATLQHAVRAVRDASCTVWFGDGVYRGSNQIDRRFTSWVTFRAIHPYHAAFVSTGMALDVGRVSSHMIFRDLEFRQSGPAAIGVLVYVSGADSGVPSPNHIVFRDNIFHDSYGDDLLKIRSGAHSIVVHGNVFYNQADGEQHIDVNSATNVTIADNIFFNDFASSGRADTRTTKHYIVVKDSGGAADGLLGSRHVTITSNVFLTWEGGVESFVAIGNDGAPYLEAQGVLVENNLVVAKGTDRMYAIFTVSGASDVGFVNNTVVGSLPSEAYAFNVNIKGSNPKNRDIVFSNDIWCDPTRTMSSFSGGTRSHTIGLTLDDNLYWNGGARIPGGDLVSPLRRDARRVVSDPGLNPDQSQIVFPIWTGWDFRSGNGTIRQEFVRLVMSYGRIPADSPAVGRALVDKLAPSTDILGRRRDRHPDLGAFEAGASGP
jgi:hypothetical protein